MAGDETLFTEAGMRRQITYEGLDFDEFDQCLREGRTLPIVQASYDEGVSRGVQGTPTVFVNDELVEPTFAAIAEAVERALADAAQ